MSKARIDAALARLNAAMARIDGARPAVSGITGGSEANARILSLVNAHEKLRENVVDTIAELDALIAELER